MDIRIIAIGIIILVVTIINVIFMLKTKDKKTINFDALITLFKDQEINNIDYIRNKIVVTFNNVSKFDLERLKEQGAKGINVVGEKIKFFVSDDNKQNQELYDQLTRTIEG